jgi:ribulose-bisphosphate carboxylase large chain
MATVVVFGQLPRLAGADASIYPSYDGYYSMTREDCRHIVLETFVPIGHLPSIWPTSAGRISGEKVKEVVDLYQHDVVMIAGGGLLQERPDLTFTCPTLM